ncbi:MAG TPA: endonuclease III [Verrucomicrobiae bacterium]|nr:endonuclease III [Verrucomicrobiae bacterium]
MARESSAAKQARVRKIVASLKRTHPDAKLALDFTTPLELLVALILAAQARDDLVNTVTPPLFRKYRSAADYAGESEAVLQQQVSRINFFRQKTRSIQRAAAMLVKDFGGQVSDNLDDLLKLPGVGRKTANAVLANAFGQPAIVVDTHTWRLSQRLGLTMKDDPDRIEADLVTIVPRKDWTKFCHLLQFHGRRVCLARNPDCVNCSINKLCPRIGVGDVKTGKVVKR